MSRTVVAETSADRDARERLRASALHWFPTLAPDLVDRIVSAAWIEALDADAIHTGERASRALAAVRRHAAVALGGAPPELPHDAATRIAALAVDDGAERDPAPAPPDAAATPDPDAWLRVGERADGHRPPSGWEAHDLRRSRRRRASRTAPATEPRAASATEPSPKPRDPAAAGTRRGSGWAAHDPVQPSGWDALDGRRHGRRRIATRSAAASALLVAVAVIALVLLGGGGDEVPGRPDGRATAERRAAVDAKGTGRSTSARARARARADRREAAAHRRAAARRKAEAAAERRRMAARRKAAARREADARRRRAASSALEQPATVPAPTPAAQAPETVAVAPPVSPPRRDSSSGDGWGSEFAP